MEPQEELSRPQGKPEEHEPISSSRTSFFSRRFLFRFSKPGSLTRWVDYPKELLETGSSLVTPRIRRIYPGEYPQVPKFIKVSKRMVSTQHECHGSTIKKVRSKVDNLPKTAVYKYTN
jgi:hypothetical protein